MTQQVTIIGLGLIGGSIGLALKRWSRANDNSLTIVGFDEDVSRQNKAKKLGAIDSSDWSLGKAVANADVVILATPVQAMRQVMEDIAEDLKHGAIVTDTGSTKVDVMEWARSLPSTVSFIGGHPMAGKAESLDAADPDLFKGATWVVSPSVTAEEEAIRTVLGIVAAVGADSYFVDPAEHDSYVAAVSHLPFLSAAALVRAVTSDPAWRDMRSLAASGLRDTTRLALGSPEMHRDIAITNREAIGRWIDQYIDSLQDLKVLIADDSHEGEKNLFSYLEQAQDDRARLELTVNRTDEALTETQRQADKHSFGDQMGRMFLGGLGRSRDRNGRNSR
ncbi:MAG: prephenate dehydrogenase/arogenate dehydrogenase family protein [Chloroflexota bacterium]|nr:prephenate dehydrogenase/arogenate dehydrogenase family protein [Chloroflexota bacterium]